MVVDGFSSKLSCFFGFFFFFPQHNNPASTSGLDFLPFFLFLLPPDLPAQKNYRNRR